MAFFLDDSYFLSQTHLTYFMDNLQNLIILLVAGQTENYTLGYHLSVPK
jgi:hypothetical protein